MNDAPFQPVIGLEIHVQLATATKLFCRDRAEFGGAPNTRVCPVCLGLPGALPVVNAAAVELALRVALALDCAIHLVSRFARKHYFYPDLPKGYQITQYDQPLATAGRFHAPGPDGDLTPVRIRRVHLEEDAGRSVHDRLPGRTAVDLNRAGIPLVEIVTEPDLASPEHARVFLTRLRRLLRYVGASECDMEEGSLRVDANVSIRDGPTGDAGPKTEVKNLNSFAAVESALTYEGRRQWAARVAGEGPFRGTRLWDPAAGETRPLRTKEATQDYRYFPDPDLPPLVVREARVRAARAALPEPPEPRAARFRHDYGIPPYDADVLTAERDLADYYEAVARASGDPKGASNWVMTDVLAWSNEHGAPVSAFPVPPARLAELMALVRDGVVSISGARRVFRAMAETGQAAASIVAAQGLVQVRDTDRLEVWIDDVLDAHPGEVARYRAGETRLLGFFMGRIMERSGGTADPRRASELLRGRLGG
jgi:aspartyl-tRNA(Asn)/glutamyl-tRNA(Gln) amidotransferase subunit B